MNGFVYAIGDETGRVKIGWSSDPLRRLTKIQSDCSAKASLLGVVEATRLQESETHKLLSPWHIHGDWFRHEGLVAKFVAMLSRPRPHFVKWGGKDDGRPLRQWLITSNSTQRALASSVGCKEAHMSSILSGKRTPSPELARRISQTTGLTLETVLFGKAAE